jgi:hypothetical protein
MTPIRYALIAATERDNPVAYVPANKLPSP